MKRTVQSKDAPAPIGPYVQAVDSGEFLFLSGQIGIDPWRGDMAEGAGEQARRCMENLRSVLEEAGLTMASIVKTTIFITDMASFKEVNEAYASFFSSDPPARSTVGVAALPKDAKVEIDAIAVRAPRRSP